MPGTEQSIPGDATENLADAGPADMGRLEVDFYGNEQTITTGGAGTEGTISAK